MTRNEQMFAGTLSSNKKNLMFSPQTSMSMIHYYYVQKKKETEHEFDYLIVRIEYDI